MNVRRDFLFAYKWLDKIFCIENNITEADMIFEEIIKNLKSIKKMVVSDPKIKIAETKLVYHPYIKKGEIYFQEEVVLSNKAFHNNYSLEEFKKRLEEELVNYYRQIVVIEAGRTVSYFINPNGKIKRREEKNTLNEVKLSEHNKEKKYILEEGECIPALVDLGVFTKEYKIVSSKYDKFKQINRFIEIIDDEFKNYTNKEITILDFGCGKSYLTFIIYYYFAIKKGINAKIIGYDLKEDVVENCNRLAQKYKYDNLHFEVKDVAKGLDDQKVDMLVSLHACDTSTDYALYYAIKNKVPNIFSVPCCQHQVNSSIKRGGDFDLLLKDGLIKERFSALLTDSIRVQLLREQGYSVDVIEFVDFEHSPKNIMLRAKKVSSAKKDSSKLGALLSKYHVEQELFNLTKNL